MLLGSPLHAQSGAFAVGDTTATFSIDWTNALLSIELHRPISRDSTNAPAAPATTQANLIRDGLPLLVRAMFEVPWSSTATIGEHVADNPALINLLYDTAANASVADAKTSPDLQRAIVVFEVDLHANLTGVLLEQTSPQPVTGGIGWEPSAEYTGIVIYAADELPVFGTNRTAEIVPVVVPELYYLDESGSAAFPLIEMNQMPRSTLQSQGFATYSTEADSIEVLQRAGERPLRVLARGLFGTYPADPVLSSDDAKEILSSAQNRALLQQGRVVIIVPNGADR